MEGQERFLTICEFEDLFWAESERIGESDPKLATHGIHFVMQHPARSTTGPGPKLTNEWLPLLILAKHEAGRLRNWGAAISLDPSLAEDRKTELGQSYDAAYRVVDRNLDCDHRSGHIEITRALSDFSSEKLVQLDKQLSHGEHPPIVARNSDAGLEAMRADVLGAVASKTTKFRSGIYPSDAVLLVWLRHDDNPRWSRSYFIEEDFRQQLNECVGDSFAGVCLVGMHCGVIWIKGSGL